MGLTALCESSYEAYMVELHLGVGVERLAMSIALAFVELYSRALQPSPTRFFWDGMLLDVDHTCHLYLAPDPQRTPSSSSQRTLNRQPECRNASVACLDVVVHPLCMGKRGVRQGSVNLSRDTPSLATTLRNDCVRHMMYSGYGYLPASYIENCHPSTREVP